jgi:uncharacterized protein YecA (UPF0149 family)
MIPEELDRTIEFIIRSQARLAAAQEQDRQDRIQFEEWSKGLFAKMDRREERLSRLLEQQTRLLDHQSQRMDRLDKFYEDWLRQNGDFQQQVLDLQRQALRLLNLILDRLPPASPNPN